jgi:TPR repeat protein
VADERHVQVMRGCAQFLSSGLDTNDGGSTRPAQQVSHMVKSFQIAPNGRGHLAVLVASIAVATLAAAMPSSTLAQDFTPAETECNALASSPADDTLSDDATKVEFTLLDFEKAIPACEAALTDNVDNPRTLFQLGRSYDRSGDYAKALENYQRAADGGYAAAMRAIGILYANGDGVERNDVTSLEWHQKAVDAGSVSSLVDVGWFYFSGVAVELDQEKAIGMFEEAAEAGVGYALTMLAWAYENGNGVSLDETKAFDYYKQAAEAGDSGGMFNLALIYRDAKFGYTRDEKAAFDWFEKAADLGNVEAMLALSQAYRDGSGVARNESRSADWLEKASTLALPETAYTIGSNFEFGTYGYSVDYEQAAVWYKLAADQDYVDAVWALGRLYFEEPSLPDADQAEVLFEKAFDLGGGYWGYYTASTYESRGDFDKALEWYERSADDGDTYAMVRAGSLYETGNIVQRDSAKAEVLFERAAETNDPNMLLSIGYAYYYGDETGDSYVPNLEKALEWMRRAAEAGNEEAADIALDIEAEIAAAKDTSPPGDDTITPQDDDSGPPSDNGGKDKDKDQGGETAPPTDDENDRGKDKG